MVFYLLFLRAPTLIRPSWDKGSSFIFWKLNTREGRRLLEISSLFFAGRGSISCVWSSLQQRKRKFGPLFPPPQHPSLDMKGGGDTALLWNTLKVINISQPKKWFRLTDFSFPFPKSNLDWMSESSWKQELSLIKFHSKTTKKLLLLVYCFWNNFSKQQVDGQEASSAQLGWNNLETSLFVSRHW